MKYSFEIAIFLAICSIVYTLATTNAISNQGSDSGLATFTEEKLAQLENILLDLSTRVQDLEQKNENLVRNNNEMSSRIEDLENEKKDINAEVAYLKELSKLNVVRTCEEMKEFGINQSNYYLIDPDGPLLGKEPIRVYCDFTEDVVATKISHDSEEKVEVEHCHDAGCYSRVINYDVPMEQIQSLIELSNTCSQEINYECFLAPLQEEGVNFAYWLDKNGDSQIYWTDSHYGQHVCSCHYSESGCFEEETLNNTCNCDSNKPSELSDAGTIMNSTALPITELRFGGLSFDAQAAYHTLGKLSCSGKKSEESKAESCSDLKRKGIFKSGLYNVQEVGQHSKLVYCDMTSPGYNDVAQEFVESSESHFDEVEEYIADFVATSDNHFSQVEKSIADNLASSDSHFSQVEKEIADINAGLPNLPGKWSGGSYCILANGACPEGFTRYEGHLLALSIFSCSNEVYLKEVFFGDSALTKHANCNSPYQNGNIANIQIRACCK